MQGPATIDAFLALVEKSGLLSEQTSAALQQLVDGSDNAPTTPEELANTLVEQGVLTKFQSAKLLEGKYRGFFIGNKYKLLNRIGRGGMGAVYLCEHLIMKRRVALKVLPAPDAEDADALERFHHEARAVANLDHPNIVRAHDVDVADNIHFLVMEYVDGVNLYALVKVHGPLTPLRAAHYIRQAAIGLQHAHEAGIVHRDIKPGNLLVDRNGVVKILDLGLVRFFHAPKETVYGDIESGQALGTPDYLAPEQTFDSRVDIRADIYSLGVTFYFLVTGQNLFPQGTPAQKLIWHQVRVPRFVRDLEPAVPEEMAAVLHKMIAKQPDDRYQTPAEVADALTPLTEEPVPPPSEHELPKPIMSAPVDAPGTATPISRQTLSPVSKIRVKKQS